MRPLAFSFSTIVIRDFTFWKTLLWYRKKKLSENKSKESTQMPHSRSGLYKLHTSWESFEVDKGKEEERSKFQFLANLAFVRGDAIFVSVVPKKFRRLSNHCGKLWSQKLHNRTLNFLWLVAFGMGQGRIRLMFLMFTLQTNPLRLF